MGTLPAANSANRISQRLDRSIGLSFRRILTFGGRLSQRTAIVGWSAAGIGLGVLSSWNWLVAAGLSSIVLGILPCMALCAAGLCAGRGSETCSQPNANPNREREAHE